MARYKVVFSRTWITGRWGFTDRILHGLGGRPTDASKLENAWLVSFDGSAFALGRYLAQALNVELSHDPRDGTVFDIEELEPAAAGRQRPRRSRRSR